MRQKNTCKKRTCKFVGRKSKTKIGHQTGRHGADSGDTVCPKSYVLRLHVGQTWAPGAAKKRPKIAKTQKLSPTLIVPNNIYKYMLLPGQTLKKPGLQRAWSPGAGAPPGRSRGSRATPRRRPGPGGGRDGLESGRCFRSFFLQPQHPITNSIGLLK